MRKLRTFYLAAIAFAISVALCPMALMGAPRIEIPRQPECNLFAPGTPVRFEAKLQSFPPGTGEAVVTVTDYFGETRKLKLPVTIVKGQPVSLPLDLGVLSPSYYELNVQVTIGNATGAAPVMSFGVTPFVSRTAEEARKQGSRFGLKMFMIGSPGVWWRKGEIWNLAEVATACEKLGLQWTRQQFNQGPSDQPGVMSTDDLLNKHQMNAVLKVEGFPESCYDATRYGPIEAWVARKKNWQRNTVPLKDPYTAWLKDQISKIPVEQNIFEVGNEVWSYMSAEEFAEWCKIVVPAVKEVRPNAKIGADPGTGGDFTHRFLAAGGMDNMELWFNHPYSFTPLPEHRIRGLVRNMRDILKRRTGRDFELWVTEYGWSTAPQDKRKQAVSEKVQAQRTSRVSLMLYAEDAKSLIPHWMGDREQDVTEREHFFGFFRLNHQPKPVVIAHATCARMIDCSRFVGDLWYGPGVGAMLFERNGEYTLALWALEQDRPVKINTRVKEVTLVDIVGGEKKMTTSEGMLPLTLNGDVVYLKSVSADLAKEAVPPTGNLNPDLWSTRLLSTGVAKTAAAPVIDGALEDWAGRDVIEMKPAKAGDNPGTGKAMLSWDDSKVYAAMQFEGIEKGNKRSAEFGLSVRPDRQIDMGGTLLYDFRFKFALPTAEAPALTVECPDFFKPLEIGAADDKSGIKWSAVQTDTGWNIEMEIPVAFLKGMPTPTAGLKLSGGFILRNPEDKNRPILVYGEERPRLWPYITLETAKK